VNQNSLFKTMIACKGLLGFFYINQKEGGAERQRESVCERQSKIAVAIENKHVMQMCD
jgi:hypothetical protein